MHFLHVYCILPLIGFRIEHIKELEGLSPYCLTCCCTAFLPSNLFRWRKKRSAALFDLNVRLYHYYHSLYLFTQLYSFISAFVKSVPCFWLGSPVQSRPPTIPPTKINSVWCHTFKNITTLKVWYVWVEKNKNNLLFPLVTVTCFVCLWPANSEHLKHLLLHKSYQQQCSAKKINKINCEFKRLFSPDCGNWPMTASASLLLSGVNHESTFFFFPSRIVTSSEFQTSCSRQSYRKVDCWNVHISIFNLRQPCLCPLHPEQSLHREEVDHATRQLLLSPPTWRKVPGKFELSEEVSAAAARDTHPLPLPPPRPACCPLFSLLRYDMSSGEIHPPHLPRPSLLSSLNCLSVNILPAHFLHWYVEACQKRLKLREKRTCSRFAPLPLGKTRSDVCDWGVGGGGGRQTPIISLPREDCSLFGTWPWIVPAARSSEGF